MRATRRPSSAVVGTEFGLARPKLQWQALLLLPEAPSSKPAAFRLAELGSNQAGSNQAGSNEVGLARLPKVSSPFCFPPIAASAAHRWSGFRVCRFARNASMPCAPSAGGVCATCGERLFSSYAVAGAPGEPRCGLCRRVEPAFARAVAYGSYESGLRELIHLLKYGGVRPAANVLGRMLAEAIAALEPEFPADSVAVVPVPLHRTKLRQRGFNQAELIARAAMKISPGRDRLRLCAGVLERKRETTSQIGLTMPSAPRESARCIRSGSAGSGEGPRSAGRG